MPSIKSELACTEWQTPKVLKVQFQSAPVLQEAQEQMAAAAAQVVALQSDQADLLRQLAEVEQHKVSCWPSNVMKHLPVLAAPEHAVC